MTADTQFCPSCGASVGVSDAFCRKCGAPLAETPPEEEATSGRRGLFETIRRRNVLLVLVGLVLLLGGGAAVAALTVVGSETSASEKAEARQQALFERIGDPFHQVMRSRDTFFVSERGYLAAMRDAQRTIRKYLARSDAVDAEIKRIDNASEPQRQLCNDYPDYYPCPDPDYPSYPQVPDVDPQVEKLRAVSRQMDQVRADAVAIDPPNELSVMHAQLLAAIDALRADATHNADVLTEAVTAGSPGYEGGGTVDRVKLRTLRGETALPAIRQLNRAALKLIGMLSLSVSDYDVPGGRDLDPADHSDAR